MVDNFSPQWMPFDIYAAQSVAQDPQLYKYIAELCLANEHYWLITDAYNFNFPQRFDLFIFEQPTSEPVPGFF